MNCETVKEFDPFGEPRENISKRIREAFEGKVRDEVFKISLDGSNVRNVRASIKYNNLQPCRTKDQKDGYLWIKIS